MRKVISGSHPDGGPVQTEWEMDASDYEAIDDAIEAARPIAKAVIALESVIEDMPAGDFRDQVQDAVNEACWCIPDTGPRHPMDKDHLMYREEILRRAICREKGIRE